MAPGGKRGNGMNTIETGGPAFPLQSIGPDFAPGYAGMTLRDYFAAKYMGGLCSTSFFTDGNLMDHEIALHAYAMADAMLAARKPKYEQTRLTSHAFDDSATIAGLESAVTHLSACLDSFRALLVEVNDVCGRDGHGGPLEDGESEIIDKVRAALSMTEPAPRSKPES